MARRPDLFQSGSFVLASGIFTNFKIECDSLTGDEIEILAAQLVKRLPPFRYNVFGVPRGGTMLASAMERYGRMDGPRLICDDVYTTGGSIEGYARYQGLDTRPEGWIAAVIFARSPTPDHIFSLFEMSPELGGAAAC